MVANDVYPGVRRRGSFPSLPPDNALTREFPPSAGGNAYAVFSIPPPPFFFFPASKLYADLFATYRSRFPRCLDPLFSNSNRLGSPESAQADPRGTSADAERARGPDFLGTRAREGAEEAVAATEADAEGGARRRRVELMVVLCYFLSFRSVAVARRRRTGNAKAATRSRELVSMYIARGCVAGVHSGRTTVHGVK
jgi:hypothetical protein